MHAETPSPGRASPSKLRGVFLNRDRNLRNGWWVVAFLAVLAAMLFPAVLVSARLGHEISIWEQALLIAVATVVLQALRRKPVREVTGPFDVRWPAQFAIGSALGFLLMIVPAAALWMAGVVEFAVVAAEPRAILSALALMAGVAVAEELLFRGFLFQRLIAGMGLWPAQIIMGGMFVLTHMGNPGMDGGIRLLAGLNIFLASLMFGQAFVRTRSLALPIGLHFMANTTQGVLLGFGVSGADQPSLLTPRQLTDAEWLTGGSFGLEASLPGLLAVSVMLVLLLTGGRESSLPG